MHMPDKKALKVDNIHVLGCDIAAGQYEIMKTSEIKAVSPLPHHTYPHSLWLYF